MEASALRKQGWTISAIARHLDRDRKTVRAYVNGDRQPGVRTPAGAVVDPVVAGGAGGDLAWVGGRDLVPGDRDEPGSGAFDDQPGDQPQRWSGPLPAVTADGAAWKASTRPKVCKLAACPELADVVAEGLKQRWSPQQIAS